MKLIPGDLNVSLGDFPQRLCIDLFNILCFQITVLGLNIDVL